ncbi:Permease of the major facilitator superfamily [Yersinia mollaretii ATCC 43969]|uniref:Permease of the major facilitator superfamily n=1 Tax=Yersinia mollaretii (strain ATCC 43969 / DSM 18520 / CIP 103324 / CNY 7263 / WAIP 204) TaxID=349967 RepID=A0ABM9YC85_YERMW|nr:MFS transporter [Yersinia mollaretii]EEQ11507.1 Permease of the major facilitator superfamily [Yersinia mollaretii ATCC 43969]QKJ04294.1 MFS transporter [Yersinia mollaretii ATCC 43969]
MTTSSRTTATVAPAPAANDDATSSVSAPDVTRLSKRPYIQRGTPQFIRVTLAFFSAGLATFALLYCVQPILPLLSQDFNISPAASSLSLSAATGMLAFGLMFTGPLSDAVGRKSVMVIALMLAAICTLICSFMTSWHGILLMRALIGLSLSGVAAVAMTYLSEEIHPSFVALSMGLYISGNSIGGMSGRLITGVLSDFFSWRIALAVIGLFALAAACLFWRILPASKHFRPTSYYLSQAVVGLLSIVYLTGSYSSPKAGSLTSRYGRGPILLASIGMMLIGVTITAFPPVITIFIGMMIFTAGFFAAHSVASSWIGRRARRAKAQASSLYLFCYYAGSSVAGTLGGIFWLNLGWAGVVAFIATMLLLALYVGQRLRKLPEAARI